MSERLDTVFVTPSPERWNPNMDVPGLCVYYSERDDCYRGQFLDANPPVAFFLDIKIQDSGNAARALHRVRQLDYDYDGYVTRARDYASATVLGEWNAWYPAPGEPPITAEQFKARLKLRAVEFYLDGTVTFHFDYHKPLFVANAELLWPGATGECATDWQDAAELTMDAQDQFISASSRGQPCS